MHFRTGSRPELAGLDRDAQQAVRRLAWHFAQRHWGLHLPAVVWLAVALAHSHFGVLPGGRDYLVVTAVLFVIAVVNIRVHIGRYLRAARVVFDLLGREGVRGITGR